MCGRNGRKGEGKEGRRRVGDKVVSTEKEEIVSNVSVKETRRGEILDELDPRRR